MMEKENEKDGFFGGIIKGADKVSERMNAVEGSKRKKIVVIVFIAGALLLALSLLLFDSPRKDAGSDVEVETSADPAAAGEETQDGGDFRFNNIL